MPLKLILPAIALCSAFSLAQQPPCSNRQVTYTKPDKSVLNKIILAKSRSASDAQGKREPSPQATRWMIVRDADYTQPGPWSTTLVFGDDSRGALLAATFRDHGNTFTAQWLSEKLVFIRVWWGRVVSSDLILDIDRRQFIYHELADYGGLTAPCK